MLIPAAPIASPIPASTPGLSSTVTARSVAMTASFVSAALRSVLREPSRPVNGVATAHGGWRADEASTTVTSAPADGNPLREVRMAGPRSTGSDNGESILASLAVAVPTFVAVLPVAGGAADQQRAAPTCASAVDAEGSRQCSPATTARSSAPTTSARFRSGGRVLWLFQDAFMRAHRGSLRLVHNVGLVQRGLCFRALRSGTATNPTPWIGAAATIPEHRWFWPLAGSVGAMARSVCSSPRWSSEDPAISVVPNRWRHGWRPST